MALNGDLKVGEFVVGKPADEFEAGTKGVVKGRKKGDVPSTAAKDRVFAHQDGNAAVEGRDVGDAEVAGDKTLYSGVALLGGCPCCPVGESVAGKVLGGQAFVEEVTVDKVVEVGGDGWVVGEADLLGQVMEMGLEEAEEVKAVLDGFYLDGKASHEVGEDDVQFSIEGVHEGVDVVEGLDLLLVVGCAEPLKAVHKIGGVAGCDAGSGVAGEGGHEGQDEEPHACKCPETIGVGVEAGLGLQEGGCKGNILDKAGDEGGGQEGGRGGLLYQGAAIDGCETGHVRVCGCADMVGEGEETGGVACGKLLGGAQEKGAEPFFGEGGGAGANELFGGGGG